MFAINVAIAKPSRSIGSGLTEYENDVENKTDDEDILICKSFGASKFGNSSVQIDANTFATILKERQRGQTVSVCSVFLHDQVTGWV